MRLIRAATAIAFTLLLAACAPMADQWPSDAASGPTMTATIRESRMDGVGDVVGIVQFHDSQYGLMIVPNLLDLEPGPHALHIHENPDCSPSADGNPAGAAGSHYDPQGLGRHAGPYGEGHLGDLPNLIAESDGTAKIPIVAPRPKLKDIKGRSLMIHAGADKYDSYAEHQHGTGGPRMYCGVIR